jgi:nucleoid DNA-binding protein
MASKIDLDLRVAMELELPRRQVAKITARFIEHMRERLVVDWELSLPGFGRLKVLEYQGPSANLTKGTGKKGRRAGKIEVERPVHLKVFFRKAPALRSALKRRQR